MTTPTRSRGADSDRDGGLTVERLDAFYGPHQIIWGVDFTLRPGSGVAVMGRNGVGKTTLFRAITKTFGARAAGRVVIDGEDATSLRTDQIARLGVAFVPSDRRVFPVSVRDNLKLAARGAGDWETRVARAIEYFPFLAPRMDQRADTLSGGEQQALAVARATMMNPRLMLLDEPTEGLAPVVVASLIEGIQELQRELGVGILIAERNLPIVRALCEEVFVLVKGRVAYRGDVEAFAEDTALQTRLLTPSV